MEEIKTAIQVINDKPMVSSRDVAKAFSKNHFHILRTIKAMEITSDFRASNFGCSNYSTTQGKIKSEFLMTKDGFLMLVMGFTGKQAFKIKEEFINEFNKIDRKLRHVREELLPKLISRIEELEDKIHRLEKPKRVSRKGEVYYEIPFEIIERDMYGNEHRRYETKRIPESEVDDDIKIAWRIKHLTATQEGIAKRLNKEVKKNASLNNVRMLPVKKD